MDANNKIALHHTYLHSISDDAIEAMTDIEYEAYAAAYFAYCKVHNITDLKMSPTKKEEQLQRTFDWCMMYKTRPPYK